MTNHTATVEVLTAEVRVLMVGSRQVTLGVFRQLDNVRIERINPFGRVKDPRDTGDIVRVVGIDPEGVLVRSFIECVNAYDGWWYKMLGEYPSKVGSSDPWAGEHWDSWNSLPLIVLAGLT